MSTILRSQIIPHCCNAVIASLYRHDFHRCPCGQTAIDGGRDYVRICTNHSWTDATIKVDQNLSNAEAGAVLAVYKAIYAAYEDGRKNRGVPISAIHKYMPKDNRFEGSDLRLSTILRILEQNEIILGWPVGKAAYRCEPKIALEQRTLDV